MRLLKNKTLLVLSGLAMLAVLVFLHACIPPWLNIYPKEQWKKSAPEMQGLHSQYLADMLAHIHENHLAIDSVTVIRNGHMVLDAYFYPFEKGTRHPIKSCTKSFTSAAFGIARDQGYIADLNQTVLDIFPDIEPANLDDDKRAITLEHLLTMGSGLMAEDAMQYRWKGLYEMYLSPDWVQYVLDRPMQAPPGTIFEYSNCSSFMLSAVIRKTTGMNTFDFLRRHLFNPLGITDAKWADNPDGISMGYSRMWLTPHDMARFGWLYLNDGWWENRQIVSRQWVEDATRIHMEVDHLGGYGYQWWVSADGNYMALGYGGQYIFVIPSKNMVVVFTSSLSEDDMHRPMGLLHEYILPAAESWIPLPHHPDQFDRLNALIEEGAATRPYIWRTEEEGMARDGLFTRTATPAFTATYPAGCRKLDLNPDYAYQVMSMRSLNGTRIYAFVADFEGPADLADFAAAIWMPALQANPYISDPTLVSNEAFILADGTAAQRFEVGFTIGYAPQNQVVVVAKKADRYVYLSARASITNDLDEGVAIVESLVFD